MGAFIAPVLAAAAAPGAATLLGGLGTVASLVTASKGAPSSSPAPAAPAALAAPAAPEASVAPEAQEAPVADTEAARVRAIKRRKASEDTNLFSLSGEDSSSTTLTKSLLGE